MKRMPVAVYISVPSKDRDRERNKTKVQRKFSNSRRAFIEATIMEIETKLLSKIRTQYNTKT